MDADNREIIAEVPDFCPNVEGLITMGKLSPEQKYIVETLSVLRQQGDWACETARVAHNISLANNKQIRLWKEKFQSPVAIAIWLLGIATCAFIGAWFKEKLFK